MKIIFLGNNYVGWKILEYLKKRDEDVKAIVVHEKSKAKYRDEIIKASKLKKPNVVIADMLNDPAVKSHLRALKPDIIISVMYDYILKKDILDIPKYGCINIHNGYLPYNAGNFANVWSIIEGTPAGATIHYMDENIDTGKIIKRSKIRIEAYDTGKTLFHKLENECIDLFKSTWPKIRSRNFRSFKQPKGRTYHRKRDVDSIDEIHLERSYKARELINILRARTFPPHESAYFRKGNKKFFIRVSIDKGVVT